MFMLSHLFGFSIQHPNPMGQPWIQTAKNWMVSLLALLCFGIGFLGMTLPAQAALPGLGHLFAGNAPTNLGLKADHLAPCPASPNCVLSQDPDPAHAILPLVYASDRATAYQTLKTILSTFPRTQIITETEDYIRVEFQTRWLGFVDDAEFYFPEETVVIQVRSASRLGESDLGVNRERLEAIRLKMDAIPD